MKVTAASLLLAGAVASASAFVSPKAFVQSPSSSSRLFEGELDSAEAISSLTKDVTTVLKVEEVDATLPHRYPFALVDKVVFMEPGKKIVGVKCVTKNEEFFQGHFPGQPVMPGVLQVEALAQLAGIVCLRMEGTQEGSIFLFAGVDGVKWKRPVVPGACAFLFCLLAGKQVSRVHDMLYGCRRFGQRAVVVARNDRI